MTNQEAVKTMREHLLKQGGRAMNHNETACVYRASDGGKCAIGCLIPDEDYRPEFEEHLIHNIIPTPPSLKNLNLIMLSQAQRIHDKAYRISSTQWEDYINAEFDLLEKEHNLN